MPVLPVGRALSEQIHMADQGLASGVVVPVADAFDHAAVVVPDLPEVLHVAAVQVQADRFIQLPIRLEEARSQKGCRDGCR